MAEPENVVPFRRTLPPIYWSNGRVQTECDELVHLFASIPGRCQCGERTWEKEPPRAWEDQGGVIVEEAP